MSISFEELQKALDTLHEALNFSKKVETDPTIYKIARDACIQRFEYCIELSWKTSVKALGSQTKFAKPAIREMARADLIDSAEIWLDFIEARNNTSHSYDENVAKKVFYQIVKFHPESQELLKRLRKLP